MAGSLTLLTLVKSPFPAYRILDGNITCSFRPTWRVRTRSGPLGTPHRRRPTSRPGTHGAGIRAAEGAKPGHPLLENAVRQGTPCFYELSVAFSRTPYINIGGGHAADSLKHLWSHRRREQNRSRPGFENHGKLQPRSRILDGGRIKTPAGQSLSGRELEPLPRS